MKMIIFSFLFLVLENNVQSCVRGDLTDRSPEEVLQKSREMATTLPYASAVGMVTNGSETGSGVLLDSTHVLTAAHSGFLYGDLAGVVFTNYATFGWRKSMHEGCSHSSEKAMDSRVLRVDIHPSFSFSETVSVLDDSMVLDSRKLDEYTRAMGNLDRSLVSYHFSGVDLAVLTLEKPIQVKGGFPEFFQGDFRAIQNAYGVTFGYGPQCINQSTEPPIKIGERQGQLFRRHVVSNQVSFNLRNGVVYGNYHTHWGTGDESFVPTVSMRKTEGLPVGGDSGGPFFLEVGESRALQLAGITSCTMTRCPDILSEAQIHALRGVSGGRPTPLYPIWTPVGIHMPWITSVINSFRSG